jgi:hypothetical protein
VAPRERGKDELELGIDLGVGTHDTTVGQCRGEISN